MSIGEKLQKVLLAIQKFLVTMEVADTGMNEALVIKENNKPIALFKDAANDPLCETNVSLLNRIKRFFFKLFKRWGFIIARDDALKGQSYVSDSLTYELFLAFQKHGLTKVHVPETTILKDAMLEGKIRTGSLLSWVENAVSLETHCNIFKKLTKIPPNLDTHAFEQMAIIDVITGNLDRKAENMLVSNEGLFLIDNSWAFSPVQGEELCNHHFIWGTFPALKNLKFSSESKTIITNIYKQRFEYARMVFEKYREADLPNETFELSYQRAMCVLHRIEMLYYLACIKTCNLHELSEMRFEEQFLKIDQEDERLQLSAHFLDLSKAYLSDQGICLKGEAEAPPLTPAELKYATLYDHKKPTHVTVVEALEAEIKRLNTKPVRRDCGLWRERCQAKATQVNERFAMMKRTSKDLRADIEQDLRKQGPLFKTLNEHTSFVFKFTPSHCTGDTQSIVHLRPFMS